MRILFALGMAVLLGCPSQSVDAIVVPAPAQNTSAAAEKAPAETIEKFRLSMIGEARASDGTPLGVRTYVGSKETAISITYGTFQSPEKSKAELQHWIQIARNMVQQEQKKNSSGEVVGQRVLATLIDSRTHRDFSVVAWTNGCDFFRIKSFSLPAVLLFEDRINKGISLDDLPPSVVNRR